jgi:hypothetical protein
MCAFHAGLNGIDRNQFTLFEASPNFYTSSAMVSAYAYQFHGKAIVLSHVDCCDFTSSQNGG